MLRSLGCNAGRSVRLAAPAVTPTALAPAPVAAFSSAAATAASLSPYPAGRDRHLPRPSASIIASGKGYESLVASFTWPHIEAGITHYNIGVDITDKWAADPSKADCPALLYEDAEGEGELVTASFKQSAHLSSLLAHAMQQALSVAKGDRVAILMSQSIETALVHAATYKAGAIAVPLFILFGPEAIEYRLADSGARVVCVEAGAKLAEVLALKAAGRLPLLEHVVVAPPLSAIRYQDTAASIASGNGPESPATDPSVRPSQNVAAVHHLSTLLAQSASSASSRSFRPVQTLLDDPALIIYTSGTTGPPKGALHAHRVLLGHLPGVEFPHEFFPQHASSSSSKDDKDGGDLFWTPADWAWIGGLIDVLLPSLHHGIPVYACRFKKFDPELAFAAIERRGVRNMFMPPTALKVMRGSVANPRAKYPRMKVRSIGSGGEPLGDSLLEWGKDTFSGVQINEFYGQTECNLVLGNCSSLFPPVAGSMGRAVPGHVVDIVDESTGQPMPQGGVGCIGVKQPHPVMMLRYWNKPEATRAKFAGEYLLTGDLAKKSPEGFFTFFGRADDVIKSSGYRIGPAEIEECLMKHPSVAMVACIGVPDEQRGERVKVYVVLRPEAQESVNAASSAASSSSSSASPVPSDPYSSLRLSIQQHVKGRLAAYEYPREVEFVQSLPMTPTGKVIRKDLKAKHLRDHPQGHKYQGTTTLQQAQ